MGRDDWYRNTSWSSEIRDDFFARLGRARSQRDQYLVIQALALTQACPEIALELVQLYFDTRTDRFNDARAYDARATAHRRLGNIREALESLQDALALDGDRKFLSVNAFIDYPYLVAIEDVSAHFVSALDVLRSRQADCVFPVQKFMWHAAHALILRHSDAREAKSHARAALEAAGVPKSPFPRHPNIGLVGEEHRSTMERLHAIDT